MFIMRIFTVYGEIEDRRFCSQSELASFLRVADLSDVAVIIISREASNQRLVTPVTAEAIE